MSEKDKPESGTQPEYPRETEGSRIARETRQQANNLSDEELDRHFAGAMALIYGGRAPEQESCTGHERPH